MDYDPNLLINSSRDPLHKIKETIHTMNGNISEAIKSAVEAPECIGTNGSMMSKKELLVDAIKKCHKESNSSSSYHDIITGLMKQNMHNTLNTVKKDDNKSKPPNIEDRTFDLIKTGLDKTFNPEQIIILGMLLIDEYRTLLK